MKLNLSDQLSTILDAAKWIGGGIVAIGSWLAGRWALRHSQRERRKRIVRHLHGLPNECKAVLLEFHEKGAHTLRGDPYAPPMRVLISQGVVTHGPGGGTYDAIDCYLTVKSEVWDVMDRWVRELDAGK
jgi:hypothetical protein